MSELRLRCVDYVDLQYPSERHRRVYGFKLSEWRRQEIAADDTRRVASEGKKKGVVQ